MSEIENIKNSILNKNKDKRSSSNIFDVWHQLMSTYGYISFKEFIEIPAIFVNELCKRINEDNKIKK
jgi:hypothetical protein